MKLEILTPDTEIFSGDVTAVMLPGVDGLFEILENHAPMIAAIKKGVVSVVTNEDKKTFELTGGVVEVLKNKILVLAL